MSSTHTVLGGGVASDVVVVQEPGGREVVIKQALPKLKVAADWHSNPARSTREVEALRAAATLLDPGSVPQVLWVDAENHRFAMERIDPGIRNWRAQLEIGQVDLETAARAGELLAQLHQRSAERPQFARQFDDREFFEQLRIQPFFIRSAQRNPEASGGIRRVIELLQAPGRVLVHGDYSPKNILSRGSSVVVLDWEVAHWGDPRFDVAFCLSHLLLGGMRLSTSTAAFKDACRTFSEAYMQCGMTAQDDDVLVALIACLVLARLDGDSPVDYLHDLDVPKVRHSAIQLILHRSSALFTVIDRLLY